MQKNKTTRRNFMKQAALLGVTVGTVAEFSSGVSRLAQAGSKQKALPTPTWKKLPEWHGFNLLEKFMVFSNKRFLELDFKILSENGFDFVRLPMDYRCWTEKNNKRGIIEKTMTEIDEAVEFGRKYGIHVCLNFHRAPGYTVAKPQESPLLWTDTETREVCAFHWNYFAKRYRDIPNENLSFNLFNEPSGVEPAEYAKVVRIMADAIRSESPERLIISDGMGFGRGPVEEMTELKIAQATRGYLPGGISHYKASWAGGENMPEPTWPSVTCNGFFSQPNKREVPEETRQPMMIEGPFNDDSILRINVKQVSSRAKLVVRADGKEIFFKEFKPGPDKGEWIKVYYSEHYKIYQNFYDYNCLVEIPKGTRKVEIQNIKGDWLVVSEIGLSRKNGPESMIKCTADWANPSTKIRVENKDGTLELVALNAIRNDRETLYEKTIVPWLEYVKRGGGGIMVGEFGAYNKTPHDIVLRWMEDLLTNWKKVGWGWAMWNFRGSFGIADSKRADVQYEDWNGLKLDRKMFDLLQKYM